MCWKLSFFIFPSNLFWHDHELCMWYFYIDFNSVLCYVLFFTFVTRSSVQEFIKTQMSVLLNMLCKCFNKTVTRGVRCPWIWDTTLNGNQRCSLPMHMRYYTYIKVHAALANSLWLNESRVEANLCDFVSYLWGQDIRRIKLHLCLLGHQRYKHILYTCNMQ